jgi:hypothetical protein
MMTELTIRDYPSNSRTSNPNLFEIIQHTIGSPIGLNAWQRFSFVFNYFARAGCAEVRGRSESCGSDAETHNARNVVIERRRKGESGRIVREDKLIVGGA